MAEGEIVFLVYCDWVPEAELHGVFASHKAADVYIDSKVGTPTGYHYHNRHYAREQFYVEEYEVRG